jgi:DNA polymerase III subunit delta'
VWGVIGQKKAVSLLRRSLETGTVSHAYLLTGPAHSGKMKLALELAMALNCSGSEKPCGQCDSCRKITDLKHADVQITRLVRDEGTGEVKSKTEISIEQIRQIQHDASLPPFEGKYKVFIIDGAESLSIEASNALLKTLEEPESGVVFILLAVDPDILPVTVVSRCQTLDLVPVPIPDIENDLTSNRGIGPEKAALLARLSRGRFGWAVSAAQDESLLEKRAELLESIIELTDADYEERFAYSTQLATRFSQDRISVYERLDLWLDWWRDLLLVKTGLVDYITNIDRLNDLNEIAEKRSLGQIRNFISSIQSASKQLKQNANPRLVLEVLMLDVPEASWGQEAIASDMR